MEALYFLKIIYFGGFPGRLISFGGSGEGLIIVEKSDKLEDSGAVPEIVINTGSPDKL